MDNAEKQAQGIAGIQDTFLNAARKDRLSVTIYLVSGVKLSGRIRSFDKYALILESGNQEQLIYKHAISTVVVQKMHLAHHTTAAGESKTLALDGASETTVNPVVQEA